MRKIPWKEIHHLLGVGGDRIDRDNIELAMLFAEYAHGKNFSEPEGCAIFRGGIWFVSGFSVLRVANGVVGLSHYLPSGELGEYSSYTKRELIDAINSVTNASAN